MGAADSPRHEDPEQHRQAPCQMYRKRASYWSHREVFELEMLGQLGAFGSQRHRTNKEINYVTVVTPEPASISFF
jgi:hypothetical protein